MTGVCPRSGCGLDMRPCAMMDAWECRCGMRVAADGTQTMLAPFVDREPGIVISHRWRDIFVSAQSDGRFVGFWGTYLDATTPGLPSQEEIDNAATIAIAARGMRLGKPEIGPGRRLRMINDHRFIKRENLYCITPVAESFDAVSRMIDHVGSGGVLYPSFGSVIHSRSPVDDRPMGGSIRGVPHMLLKMYYFYDAEG